MRRLKKGSILMLVSLLCLLAGCSQKNESKESTSLTDSEVTSTEMRAEETTTAEKNVVTPSKGKSNYKDKGKTKVLGMKKTQDFLIKMTDKYTFRDPSYIDFDTRYVLYGGPKCNMARQGSSKGNKCIGAYEILYAKNNKAAGEFKFYVMADENEAKATYQEFSKAYKNDKNTKCVREKDVIYIYSTGDYVQRTYIQLYADYGTISEATPEAYLGMQFFFRGMKVYEYNGSSTDKKAGKIKTVKKITTKKKKNNSKKNTKKKYKKKNKKKKKKQNASNAISRNKKDFYIKADGYIFKDPAGLKFDTRYALFGGMKCEGVKVVRGQGFDVKEVYVVLYVKDNKPVREYRIYVTKDATEAKKMSKLYTGKVYQNVLVKESSAKDIEQFIEYYVKYGGMKKSTLQAYVQFMLDNENYTIYKMEESKDESNNSGGNTNGGQNTETEKPTENENPGDSVLPKTVEGTTKENSFDVVIHTDFVFTNPENIDFDTRYVLHGNENCQYAKQYEALEFYEIMYSKENKVVAEYKCFVADSEEKAKKLKEQFSEYYGEDVLLHGRVVIIHMDGSYTQETIDLYGKMGICEATPKAYLERMFLPYAMTECKKEQNKAE